MKVYFIGAGPGAVDLITLRGLRILQDARMVLYAGSLVPVDLLKYCRTDAESVDTAKLNLDEQIAYYARACVQYRRRTPALRRSLDLWRDCRADAAPEQLGMTYEIVPGVSSFSAAAAALGVTLTRPEVSQSIVLTRVSARASAVPATEAIAQWAPHRASMCIFLSGAHLKKVVADLSLHYPLDTPVALVHRVSWRDERIHRSTLGKLLSEVRAKDWQLTTLLLIGETLEERPGVESSL